MSKAINYPDGIDRCSWCNATDEYIDYHDKEWGYPVDDDQRLFEKICLEGFQSGLSWRTILSKRENFRAVFKQFDFNKIAKFSDNDIERLLQDEGIIRHRGKIEATINNAKCAQDMLKQEGSLAAFFWRYEPAVINHQPQTVSITAESIAMAKELKKRGWKFIGPTTAYAFMQAMGLVNDHAEGCSFREKAERVRKPFKRPV